MSVPKKSYNKIGGCKTPNLLIWSALVLLIPATLFLVFTADINTLILLAWLGLALIALSYTLVLQINAHRKTKELKDIRKDQVADRSQLVTILNSMSAGMMSVNTTGKIILYNAALLSLIDTNDDVTGQDIGEIFQTFDSVTNAPIDLMSLVQKSYLTRVENITLRYEENEEIRLGITINPVRGSRGSVTGYIFIIDDITKEKSLEEERDEFISIVSHELRTPIAIAEGSISNAQLLLERKVEVSLLQKTFNEAHEQIVFLANMVNDLGTLSRAERGIGDSLESVDIDKLASKLLEKYSPRAQEHKLHLNLDIAGRIGSIATSPLYLEEILQNLITNAIKYTRSGSITLNIKKTAEGLLFAVKDTGIGMSKADQRHVFDKFYRSEDYRTRETSGTGLGLYVVQKLANKLGVTIEVTSRLNHGSAFSFVLPLE